MNETVKTLKRGIEEEWRRFRDIILQNVREGCDRRTTDSKERRKGDKW